ncbi:hypothetical protein CU048_15505 [Beijerinckiaceae bacterium]|nr:hypothetical protein CU048_15505 [Beijerinckiaceae bacterium]
MSDNKDFDYEYVEVKVTKKIEITLSPGELLALAQRQAGAVVNTVQDAPRQGAGRIAKMGQALKDTVMGRPKDSG